MLKRTLIFVMSCCFAAPLMTSCGDDGDSKKPEVKCPETCTNGCEEDGVTCKADGAVCPESCANGCKEDGVTCKDDAVCPDTCKNGCKEDGVTCKEEAPVCPDTCANGCEEDGVTCKEEAPVCPDTCKNGCKEDGVTCRDDEKTCPDLCTNGCDEDGYCLCSPECPDACEDDGSCSEVGPKCPDSCPDGQYCDETTSYECKAIAQFGCPVTCPDGAVCDETTEGRCMKVEVNKQCTCPEGSICEDPETGICVKEEVTGVCPVCDEGSHCDEARGVCMTDENEDVCPKCAEGSACNAETKKCETEDGAAVCPVCAEGSTCDAETGACSVTTKVNVCPACREGSHCDETTSWVCVNDENKRVCPVCDDGMKCDEETGFCVTESKIAACSECAEGSHCDETTEGVCVKDDGTSGCPVCPTGTFCDETTRGLCQNNGYVPPVVLECETGELKCEGNVLMECGNDNHFAEAMNCEEGDSPKSCFVNEQNEIGCFESACEPGTAICQEGAVMYCSDYHKYELKTNCSELTETPICEEGSNSAYCVAPCEFGATKCVDNKVMECIADGIFVEKDACDAATHDCRQEEGQAAACVQHDCAEGESKCDGSQLVVCDAGWWKVGSDCSDSGLLCSQNDKTATCVEKKCDEGWKLCDGQYLNTCTNNEYVVKFCKSMGGDYQCIDANDGNAECREVKPILTTAADTDNDTIADWIECNLDEPEDDDNPIDYAECDKIDTDKDGTPDYKDDDSDGDTIPDKIEANNDGGKYEPDDADYDSIPNYRDLDSDGNGIPDKDEYQNGRDLDGDTIPDYLDYDNDNDGFSDKQEIEGIVVDNPKPPAGKFSGYCRGQNTIGTAANPVDCDGDGTPDYNDTDSDNDGLSDKVEGMVRLSSNGFLARYNPDTDGDGIDDKTECSKSDVKSLAECLDSDCYNTKNASGCYVYGYNAASCDGIPDLLEKDSDGDGLADDFEEGRVVSGWKTNRLKADSDGDCATDMIEYGAGTSPTNAADNPVSKGNFVFVVPYEDESSPKKQSLSFETAIQTIDIFFNYDQSSSINDEIKKMKEKLPGILKELQCEDLKKACTENSECSGLKNSAGSSVDAICSEKGRCIVNPKSGDGCFDDMEVGMGYYSYIDSFWVAVGIGEKEGSMSNADTVVTALDRYYPAGDKEVAYQGPICAAEGISDNCKIETTGNWKETNTCKPASDKCKGQSYGNSGVSNKAVSGCYSNCKRNCVDLAANPGRSTCVGYRNSAIHIYTQIFDEEQCRGNTGASNYASRCESFFNNVGPIMKNHKMRWIGLQSSSSSSYCTASLVSNVMTLNNCSKSVPMAAVSDYIGKASGSLGTDGKAFTYTATGSDIDTKFKSGVRSIAKNMPMDITSEISDIDKNASKLIKKLNVNTAGGGVVQNRTCAKITNTITNSSGVTPGISQLLPGKVVCYDVIPVDKQNLFKPTNVPQILKARIKVLGDGSTLNSGIAYFLVPPLIEDSKGEAGN